MSFKWEVVEKNKAGNNLLVKFQSADKPDILVGTPFPPKDEDVDAFMTRYAPFHIWAIDETTQDIEVGHSSEVVVQLPTTETQSLSSTTEEVPVEEVVTTTKRTKKTV